MTFPARAHPGPPADSFRDHGREERRRPDKDDEGPSRNPGDAREADSRHRAYPAERRAQSAVSGQTPAHVLRGRGGEDDERPHEEGAHDLYPRRDDDGDEEEIDERDPPHPDLRRDRELLGEV